MGGGKTSALATALKYKHNICAINTVGKTMYVYEILQTKVFFKSTRMKRLYHLKCFALNLTKLENALTRGRNDHFNNTFLPLTTNFDL